MRKLLTTLVFLLVLLLFAAPGLMALGLRVVLPDVVRSMDVNADDYDIALSHFESGYLSSQIGIQIKPVGRTELSFVSGRLRHLLPLGALLGFDGEIRTPDFIAALTASLDFSLHFEALVQPASGYGSGSLEVVVREDHVIGVADALTAGEAINNLNGRLEFTGTQSEDWTTRLEATAESLDIPEQLSALQLDVDLKLDRSGENLNVSGALDAGKLERQGRRFTELTGRMDVTRLHGPTTGQLVDAIVRILDEGGPNASQRINQAVVTALGPIMIHQPVVERLDLRFDSGMGQASINSSAAVIARPPSNFLASMDALMSVVELSIEADLADGIVAWYADRQVRAEYPGYEGTELGRAAREEVIANLVNNQVLKPIVGGYEFNVDYQPGKVVLNGQSMSLPDGFFSQM